MAGSDDENESSYSESVKVKKKCTKKCHTEESDSEVESTIEMVDDDEPAEPEVKEVNDGHGNQLSDEQDVSINVQKLNYSIIHEFQHLRQIFTVLFISQSVFH